MGGESFEELIRGRYKEEFDERVQKIIGGRLRRLRQENDELQSRMQRQEESEDRAIEELVRSRDSIRALYPAYDPVREAENPHFCRLIRAGVPPRAAYEAVHHNELMREAMQYAAKRSARQTARAIASGGARVAENGGGSMAVSRNDPKTLTSRELADIRKRVFSGEKIRF